MKKLFKESPEQQKGQYVYDEYGFSHRACTDVSHANYYCKYIDVNMMSRQKLL